MTIRDTEDGDLLVAKITGQSYNTHFDVSLNNWASANLIAPSVVRVHKMQTIYTQLVFGHIGKLTNSDRTIVRQLLMRLLTDL